jgi:hypothetical protein
MYLRQAVLLSALTISCSLVVILAGAARAEECTGENCMPEQGNPTEECTGENCAPAPENPVEECGRRLHAGPPELILVRSVLALACANCHAASALPP